MRSIRVLGFMLLLLSLPASIPVWAGSGHDSDTREIGSRRELFVDRFLIDRLRGVRLQLHEPRPAEQVIRIDRPWENEFNYGYKVFQEGGLYHLIYLARTTLPKEQRFRRAISYARSRDGIHWEKPNLGLVEVDGSRENNVIMLGRLVPFVDNRPGVPANRRIKATSSQYRDRPDWKNEHPLDGRRYVDLFLYESSDGLDFRKVQEDPVFITTLPNGFDGVQSIFWSESEGKYLLYFRYMTSNSGPRKRSVARSTSPDLLSWTDPVPMEYTTGGIVPPEHLYEHQTVQYFRAPHIYVAFPPRFMYGRSALTKEQAEAAGVVSDATQPKNPNWLTQDCADAAFMTSRGGTLYDRTFMEVFVRPGPDTLNWVSRTNYPLQGVVQTGPAEMSIYAGRHYGHPTWHIQRLTLRLDGFASVNAPYAGGEMITKPLKFSGNRLEINYSTSAAGGLRVEIQDSGGKPIPGFSLAECPEIIGDEIARDVSWEGGGDLGRLAGTAVRLRFVMKDADLYSIRFHD